MTATDPTTATTAASSLSLRNITLDCTDVSVVARFWSRALGRPLDAGGNGFFTSIGLGAPEGGPAWLFLAVPEGKTAKNRMHVDLGCADRRAEIDRLVALGATHVADKDEWGHSWSVLLDPEGNEFCIAD